MTEATKFDFDTPMQDDILKLCISNPLFAEAATNWIKPTYFRGDEKIWLAGYCNDFTLGFGVPPTKSEIRQGLRLSLEQGTIKEKKAATYSDFIERLFKEPVDGSRKFTIDQVKKFAHERAWEAAIVDAMPLLKQGKFTEMAELMEEASNAVYDLDAGGYWYFETLETRSLRRASSEEDEQIIPMGIMELDECRRRKGLGPGEAACWIGPKGSGKSIALGHVTRRAIFDRRQVAYFSLEMDDEINADRLDSGFSGVHLREMREEHERVLEALRPLAKRFPRSLFIKRYPTKGASIKDINRCLQNLEKSYKWRPGMIVLDYLTITKPARIREQRRDEILELSEDFRGLLGEWRVPGHTAVQLNRSGAKMRIAQGTEVAGSWDALAIFDIIYIINQDPDEKARNELRIFIDKDRDGWDKKEIGPITTAWERMCFAVRPNKMPWDVREEILYKKAEETGFTAPKSVV